MEKKKCFYIAPIDEDGSEIRPSDSEAKPSDSETKPSDSELAMF